MNTIQSVFVISDHCNQAVLNDFLNLTVVISSSASARLDVDGLAELGTQYQFIGKYKLLLSDTGKLTLTSQDNVFLSVICILTDTNTVFHICLYFPIKTEAVQDHELQLIVGV